MSDFDTVFKQFKDNTKPMCELMGCPELVEDFILDAYYQGRFVLVNERDLEKFL